MNTVSAAIFPFYFIYFFCSFASFSSLTYFYIHIFCFVFRLVVFVVGWYSFPFCYSLLSPLFLYGTLYCDVKAFPSLRPSKVRVRYVILCSATAVAFVSILIFMLQCNSHIFVYVNVFVYILSLFSRFNGIVSFARVIFLSLSIGLFLSLLGAFLFCDVRSSCVYMCLCICLYDDEAVVKTIK